MNRATRFLLLTAALLCGSLLATSCTTTGPGGEVEPDKYLEPGATIAAAVAIERGKTDEDRVKIAGKIILIADAIELLTGDALSGEDLAAVVIQYGGKEAHFRALALTVTILFDKYAPRYTGTDVAITIREIAKGLSAGAKPYAQ